MPNALAGYSDKAHFATAQSHLLWVDLAGVSKSLPSCFWASMNLDVRSIGHSSSIVLCNNVSRPGNQIVLLRRVFENSRMVFRVFDNTSNGSYNGTHLQIVSCTCRKKAHRFTPRSQLLYVPQTNIDQTSYGFRRHRVYAKCTSSVHRSNVEKVPPLWPTWESIINFSIVKLKNINFSVYVKCV